MNYLYSQRYGGYTNKIIWGNLTMGRAGCVITNLAMILSYFNNRPFYPDQMLDWMQKHNGIMLGGRANYDVFCQAAGNKLRLSYTNNPKPGEIVYTMRQVYFGKAPDWHWVIDSPTQVGKIIDPWDGLVKNYNHEHKYTGQHRYFIGHK